jgi:hypothetical protein
VTLFTADEQTLILTGAALVLSIASFFWRPFPLTRKMDRKDRIEPKRYSAVLGWMIPAFILVFLVAIVSQLAYVPRRSHHEGRHRNAGRIAPYLTSVGGYPDIIGPVLAALVGDPCSPLHGEWSEFAMVYYPSRRNLLKMMTNFPKRGLHRRVAVLRMCLVKWCRLVGAS